jgi:hypothetical protein
VLALVEEPVSAVRIDVEAVDARIADFVVTHVGSDRVAKRDKRDPRGIAEEAGPHPRLLRSTFHADEAMTIDEASVLIQKFSYVGHEREHP